MLVKLTKSGNSIGFRLPKQVISTLHANVGDSFDMLVDGEGIKLTKISEPRKGWFDNISPFAAKTEAELMESDFGCLEDKLSDEWSETW